MHLRVLLDSNIIIGILNGTIHPDVLHRHVLPAISAVTVMEVYALAGMSEREHRTIEAALRLLDVLPVDAVVGKCAGELARTRRRSKPDLLIAATALVYDCLIVTLNVRDFRNIPDLRVQEP